MELECPHCECITEDDPELADGKTEEHEAVCGECGEEFLYDIEFYPVEVNVRKIPKCKSIGKCETIG